MTGGLEAQGSQATIGIQSDATRFDQVSCKLTYVKTTPFDVRFTPTP
jgi:hypothetical protein